MTLMDSLLNLFLDSNNIIIIIIIVILLLLYITNPISLYRQNTIIVHKLFNT